VSEFTRTQVIEWSGVSAEKVFNVGCGVDPTYQPAKNCYGLQFPYLLYEFRVGGSFRPSGPSHRDASRVYGRAHGGAYQLH
jgi:hypothetical protein